MTTYLDHAATTPMTPAAREAMVEQLALTGNASSLHGPGRDARRVVEESRERIAAALGARPSEIVFTSGGTEADNLAITGSLRAARAADPLRHRVVVSGVEHHAVLDVVDHAVEHEGAHATFVAPGECGTVQPDAVRAAIEEDPASVGLVSVMWANNEVGTVQDVTTMAAIAHEHGLAFHSDAVQAAGHLPVDFAASGIDLMSVSAHKFGGPLGIGALVAKRDARLVALSHGGGQERGVRSGTLDVPAIRGFAVALTEAVEQREAEAARVGALRDRFLAGTQALDLGIRVTGCWEPGDVTTRLPGNAHITIPGCEGDSMLYLLDAAGVAVSTGSACQAGIPQPSHVVLAMGRSEEEARGSLRVSFGWTSTEADVDAVLAALPEAIARARRASGAA
ncbi:cysteine desulfurase family protein [Janibacter sp. YB324]|uniref:cysteine desulfurase family protein n=1 Tax=Janibacter sp. YB324 TaxID=2761047 RepID=UPI00162A98FA|nr:cysteine desulfurase family protein [Janibacter sp. YB324]QNF95049.1 cysteine desulfurase [Janibacter sp. YB324]